MRQLLCGQKLLILILLYFYHLYAGYLQLYIYIYISETNHVSRVHSDGALLYLQFVLHVMLLRT